MRNTVVISIVLAVAAGCNTPNVQEAKVEAYKRWYDTRAQLLYGLAEEHYKVGEIKKAKNKLNEVLSLAPDNEKGRILLAKMHIGEGAYPAAMAVLTKLNQDFPDSAEVLYLLGVAQEKRGLLDDALVSYRRSQELDEDNVSPAVAAAEVLAAQGKLRQAQLYAESYMSAAGNDPAIYEVAGRIAMMTENYGQAADYYQQAYDLDLDNTCYAEVLAKSLFHADRRREAAERLKALTVKDDYETPAWVFTMLGDCYMAMGFKTKARGSYYQASEINPTSPGVWANLAKAWLAVEDLHRAIASARRALQLDSDSANAAMLLGYAMLRDGQVPGALAVLERAAAKHPESADLHCVLGRANAVAGRHDEARRCYAEALRMQPTSMFAKELLGRHEVEPTETN